MRICVVTGTRAEYGLLYWVIKTLSQDDLFELQIIATGMHLSPEFGLTYKEIEKDGFPISKKIEILLSSDTPVGISKSMGLAQISFAETFKELKPDLVLVLGDRFEIFSAVAAAMIARIPVAHCHGGEATEGLIDEAVRHSITKMSHLHFTSTEEYRRRVIQLGEQPTSVFNVGALGIENINKLPLMSKEAFEESIGFELDREHTALVTFHPVTLEDSTSEGQFDNLLKAFDDFDTMKIIFTKANADTDGRIINQRIDEYVYKYPEKAVAFTSLGQLRYLSAMNHVDVIIGNSSSGLIEAPSFKKPVINIGDRQNGRVKAACVIDCPPEYEQIKASINKSISRGFQKELIGLENPYGTGNPSERIVSILKSVNCQALLKKQFFNISMP